MTTIGRHVPVYGSVFGGFLVALVVTPLITGLTDDASAPTDLFWAKYVGDGAPSAYTLQGTLLHLTYGMCAAVVLGALEPEFPLQWPVRETVRAGLASGVANGVVFGTGLFVVALGVFRFVLELELDRRRLWLLARFHLTYGVVLGAMYGYHLNH
jgi:hypothetical protein